MGKIKVKDTHLKTDHMKYYMSPVSVDLYSKLIKEGMPICIVTYAGVFDWLISKGVSINIYPNNGVFGKNIKWKYTCYGKCNYVSEDAKDWIKTANDAISITLEHLI